MVVPNDGCNFLIVLDILQDALSNDRVLFHLPTLLESQRTRLFKKTGG